MKGASASVVLDFSQLRSITLDDEELMCEVVSALVLDTSTQIERLHRAIDLADARECARVAHCAHGACGNVGAASMAALFAAVEHQAASGDISRCRSWVDDLIAELEKLRSQAFELAGQHSA